MTEYVEALVQDHFLQILSNCFVEELLEEGESFLVDDIDLSLSHENLCLEHLFFLCRASFSLLFFYLLSEDRRMLPS